MSNLLMPEVQDYPRLPCPIEPDLTGREDPDDPFQTSYEFSYETRTRKPDSEIAAVIKAMKETGCAHAEIKEVVAILANKMPPSYDNRTRLVRETDAELKLKRKKAYDRDYQKRRYETRARDPELKNLVRENAEYISSSLTSLEENTRKESKSSGIRASEEDFDRLWRVYPRRLGADPRKPAWDKYKIAIKNGAAPEEIISGAERYADECKKTNIIGTPFINQLVVWLNQHRWKDYQQPVLAAADFNSEEYQAARRRALDAIKGT